MDHGAMSTETLTAPDSHHTTVDDMLGELPFYIAATATASGPRWTLKHDDAFVVVDGLGDIGVSGGSDGLFFRDTRYLSRLELRMNGVQPLLLGSNIRDDNSSFSADLTNPDFMIDDKIVLQRDLVHVGRTLFLWRGTAYQRLAVANHSDQAVGLTLSLFYDNDFADLFVVRGTRRRRRGNALPAKTEPDRVLFEYRGLDGVVRNTSLTFDPPPTTLTSNEAVYRLELAPAETRLIYVAIGCNRPAGQRPMPFLKGLLESRRELRAAAFGTTTIETSNALFNEVLCRSAADLRMLMTETPEGRYPYAGTPWYSTSFGRDGLVTALQMLWYDPSVARGVLRRLAAHQATKTDAASDAQPGKILHEMRGGEMAALGEVPFAHYYGSVDATPLFVLLAGLYAERTGDIETIKGLWLAIEAALGWIDGLGDPDRDGFVEYHRATELGLANQGWKDSYDAIFHADGRLAEGNIALAEVQGYVFAAKTTIARCARRLGRVEQAARLEAEAQRLAERFESAFWCPDLGTYAIALDGNKQPCRVSTSNAGQLLFTGIIQPDRAASVAAGLLGPRFFSGWGIRTVAQGEVRYNPMSYHNGSIWPHDNALIALGLARYGLKSEVETLFKGLFDAATYMDLRRLPELFCGFRRQPNRGPTLYPVACSPQAWASATPFSLVEAALGLELDPEREEIRFNNPCLPSFLDNIELHSLQLNGSTVDLKVRRHRRDVSVEITRQSGRAKVSIVSSR
jgi:glycogen debranching enzyme